MLKCPKCGTLISEYRQRVLTEKYAIDVVEDMSGDIVQKIGVELNSVNSIEIFCRACGVSAPKSQFGTSYQCRLCGEETEFRCLEGFCLCPNCMDDARDNLCPRGCRCVREDSVRETARRILRPPDNMISPLVRSYEGITWTPLTDSPVLEFDEGPPSIGDRPYFRTSRGVGATWSVSPDEFEELLDHDYWNLEYGDEEEDDEGNPYHVITKTG